MVVAGLRTFLLLGLWLPLPSLAAIQLQLPVEMEQGRMLRAELRVSGQSHDLHLLSLAPLQQQFHIEDVGDVTLSADGQQHRSLKLLPLHSGSFSLPAWGVEARQIVAARDASTGEPIEMIFQPPKGSPWQRQQVAYGIEVVTPQRFIRLQMGEPRHSHWLARLSGAQTEQLRQGPIPRYRHRFMLWLFPLQPGSQTLQLPVLTYLHDGVASHRFYPPPLALTVQALPAYLPASTQVGRLHIEPLSSAPALLLTGERSELRLGIRADGVAESLWTLPLPELQERDALQALPASGRLQEHVGLDGVSSYYQLSLPFEALQSQWRSSQPMLLEYFDPVTGKYITRQRSLAMPAFISQQQLWWLMLLLLVVLIWLIRMVLGQWQSQRCKAISYLQARACIEAASHAGELRQAQEHIARAEAWPEHMGIEAWHSRWQSLMPQQELHGWQQGMQALCYHGREELLAGLRAQLLGMLEQRLAWRLPWRLPWYRLLAVGVKFR